jgi:hypothetical protein
MHIPNGTGIFGRLTDAFLTDKYRYTEYRLQPHEQVYAIGTFRSVGGVSVDNPDGAAALRQVLDGRVAQTQPPSLNVLADPMDGRSFLLAASDGETLAQRFRRRAAAGIGGFVGSTAALTWLLLHV